MGFMNPQLYRDRVSTHLVAQAALVLAEQAYANGKPEDAANLIDMAHRLFGEALAPGCHTAMRPH